MLTYSPDKSRGAVLIVTMFLVLFIFVLGLGLLGRRAPQYESATQATLEAQARALAEAGLEDARVKLNHDQDFPPPGDDGQEIFSYRETVLDVDGQPVGYFDVQVDLSRKAAPAALIWVTSSGVVSDPLRPTTLIRKILRAEYESSLLLRGSDPVDQIPNPDYLQLLRIEEVGAP